MMDRDPQPTPTGPAAWRRGLAAVIDVVWLPLLAALVLVGQPTLGSQLYALLTAGIVLAQAACAGCPAFMLRDWLRQGATRPPRRRPGRMQRAYRRPAVRASLAALAVAVIAAHLGL